MSYNKRQTDKLIRRYGKALFAARVNFVDSFAPEKSRALAFHNRRLRLRRVAVVALILILAFTMALGVASALKLQVFNFNFAQKAGYAELENRGAENGKYFYEPTYVPKGYKLTEKMKNIFVGDTAATWTYQAGDKAYINIDEDKSRYTKFGINTENCVIEKRVINGIEVSLYMRTDTYTISAYMQINGTFVEIHSRISKNEMIAIIKGLQKE
ncbi:DUF4367 domain-containing protein [Aminicella lysinilytica]|uniref:Uncharacterized protein DUF4367 n=1 Tax=Aminicella lysinilytica TaxID=433323 RepID=A0A4R6Q3C4_9FIRM|nr:DUF4367 domain-containing protein [Aminicella lysinilytica]NLD11531.1 DUF4367 domain-containing protein [Clostridiales bacterium]TDP56435.1 uncharacterized protein DUF4367 [Aminicella lysinilytica]